MPVKIPISFINDFQKKVFYEDRRNICASGGYGNGKTYVCDAKLIFLASYFNRYRVAIFRRSSTDLFKTTIETFHKICPPELYNEKQGGKRNDHKGYLRLINGSEFLFMHLDQYDENVVRGLEVNAAFIDQAEEVEENIASHLDSRVGRWDEATPPEVDKPKYKLNPKTGKFIVPTFLLLGCNPDSTEHWIYRDYHPDSPELYVEHEDTITGQKYTLNDTHVMHQAKSTDNPALSQELIRTLTRKDEAFVKRFVEGEWGITRGTLHHLHHDSILKYDELPLGLIQEVTLKGTLYRTMDFGATAPLCVLWFAAYKDWIFCYREYYLAGTLISKHREHIANASVLPGTTNAERYNGEFADPSIFAKTMQRKNGFWSVADEFTDTELEGGPPIHWQPANNDEYMTRNRLDELLEIDPEITHPVTGEKGAPRLYFIEHSGIYREGANEIIKQLRNQKRKQVGTSQGEALFSDERDPTVADHAYDCLRYLVGTRPDYRQLKVRKEIPPGSFFAARNERLRSKFRSKRLSPSTPHHIAWQSNKMRYQ